MLGLVCFTLLFGTWDPIQTDLCLRPGHHALDHHEYHAGAGWGNLL